MYRDKTKKRAVDRGKLWVWLNAGAVSVCLIMVVGLLLLLFVRGMGHFWPTDITELTYQPPNEKPVVYAGVEIDHETIPAKQLALAGIELPAGQNTVGRTLLQIGNRDHFGQDFVWLNDLWISDKQYPSTLMLVERREWGNVFGYLIDVQAQGKVVASGVDAWPEFQQRLQRSEAIYQQIEHIESSDIGKINHALEMLRLDERKLALAQVADSDPRYIALANERQRLNQQYAQLQQQLSVLNDDLQRDHIRMRLADGYEVTLPLSTIVQAYRTNAMNTWDKVRQYGHNIWTFMSSDPREANTEGGVFPAIFGTIMMVLLMSIVVTPLGVIAAIYLTEYAKQGVMVRLIRIAVNNLAGVPSIVYGVFGLGFFVYFIGGGIDALFFPARFPAPTFGTPGLLWASLTLAILTMPVVIVATEEGLSRIPKELREGSLAMGATKAETLWRIVLPLSAPAMMTGLILAIARAAGEVAPLMMVGVVKLAPSLPIDSIPPYIHLDKQFMHLGFHIYDVGFQSPNVEAAQPLVYATAFLLVLIIIVLNLTAIRIRNRLRDTYKVSESE